VQIPDWLSSTPACTLTLRDQVRSRFVELSRKRQFVGKTTE